MGLLAPQADNLYTSALPLGLLWTVASRQNGLGHAFQPDPSCIGQVKHMTNPDH